MSTDATVADDRFGRAAVTVGAGLFVGFALLLVTRRAAGAFTRAADPAVLLLTGLLLVVLAWGLRQAGWRFLGTDAGGWFAWLLLLAPTVAILAAAWALSFERTTIGVRLALCTLIVGTEAATWAGQLRPGRRRQPAADHPDSPAAGPPAANPPTVGSLVEADVLPPPGADRVLQHLTRTRDRAGGETIVGIFRARLESGQRTTSLHVAFCPPFVEVPRFEAQLVAGPAARLKIAQVLPYSARVDLKLQKVAIDAADVVVRVIAVAGPAAENRDARQRPESTSGFPA
ncbi:MAG: hypothetical protein BMS9Abin04_452 [Planctomycetia bacterium]|nr:MAG: hypothetical protein BMS9Abin04_452 [Planctomycetia bacterium]